jgi:hypothetical protein
MMNLESIAEISAKNEEEKRKHEDTLQAWTNAPCPSQGMNAGKTLFEKELLSDICVLLLRIEFSYADDWYGVLSMCGDP